MSEHDITLVTAKSSITVIENNTVSLATPSGGLTPSTITAMVGINQGSALQYAPDVSTVMGQLNFANISNVALWPSANAALANLTTLQSKILPGGNHAAFGAFLSQAQGHIGDAKELDNTTNFVSNTSFADYGTGITSMSSMLDQGISGTFGGLPSASAALSSTGTMFNGIDPKNFGSPVGLVQALNNNKLGNATGVNQKLADAGVPIDDLNDPVYKDQITQVVGSINDPNTLKTVSDQFNLSPFGGLPKPAISSAASLVGNPTGIQNLGDLGDIKKLADPATTAGLTTDASGIATKFSDMGTNFANVGAITSVLGKISMPSLPSLDSFAPSLSSLTSSLSGVLNSMTGKSLGSALSPNLGPGGLPSATDFTQPVAGGPAFTNILQNGVTEDTIAALEASTSKANVLFQTAGVDLTTPPPAGLGSAKNFATGLHKFGTDDELTGILGNMAVPNSAYGDAIKSSLAEGKNKALLQQIGIGPLKFGGTGS